jgi:hypothetical protein
LSGGFDLKEWLERSFFVIQEEDIALNVRDKEPLVGFVIEKAGQTLKEIDFLEDDCWLGEVGCNEEVIFANRVEVACLGIYSHAENAVNVFDHLIKECVFLILLFC